MKISRQQTGHTHLIIPVLIIAVIGLVGWRLLQAGHASPAVVLPKVYQQSGPKGLPSLGATTSRAQPGHAVDINGVYFLYVGSRQFTAATGATVQLYQAQPKVGPRDYHSLAEMAVESADGRQVVEIGWITINANDRRPRLFVYHWVNGTTTCYDGCGYVQTSSVFYPGMVVKAGSINTYRIAYSATEQRWWLSYSGRHIGYFPGSLWQNMFTRSGLTQVFGEVAASTPTPCTQMGTGYFGTDKGSDYATNFQIIGARVPSSLLFNSTDPSYYNLGLPAATSFHFGGPGYCGPVK